jgi:hypothetical protein
MIGYDVKISLTPSDFPFGIIKVDPCWSNENGQELDSWPSLLIIFLSSRLFSYFLFFFYLTYYLFLFNFFISF